MHEKDNVPPVPPLNDGHRVRTGASVLLLASVLLNVGLSLKVRQLRGELRPTSFVGGAIAPTADLGGVNGGKIHLAFPQYRPVLLYWFSPACGWCQTNLPNLKALAAQSNGRYTLLPVSSADKVDILRYVQREKVQFPVYTIDAAVAKQYRLDGTPATLLLSPSGTLEKRWTGAYSPSSLEDIERTLTVRLPGIPTLNAFGR